MSIMLDPLPAYYAQKFAQAAELSARFQPDYTPEQLESLGVYDALYRGKSPRLASLGEWKPEWISEHDPKGWAQWYKRYASGRRIPEEDDRQIRRWLSFKARHGGPFSKNPTPRRGWALRNWGIDPSKLVPDQAQKITEMLDEHQRKAMQKFVQEKAAELLPEIQLQEHQQRNPGGLNTAFNDAVTLGGAAYGSRELLNRGLDRALGVQRFVHGTNTDALNQILTTGLQPRFGGAATGTSFAVNNQNFVNASKNRVHVALDNPLGRGIANMHGAIAQAFQEAKKPLADASGKTTAEGQKLINKKMMSVLSRPGNYRVGGAMPYELFQRIMQMDKDHVPFLAFKTPQAIEASTLRRGGAGLREFWKAMPRDTLGYMRRNPLRAATGVGALAAAGYMGNVGVNAAKRLAGQAQNAFQTFNQDKTAELLPEIQLQEHQQRVADRIADEDPRLLVYHGLGSGKSLSALAAAEAAKKVSGGEYGVVVPASLRGNFQKEIKKFTRNSNPEILSYTGLALGKRPTKPLDTVVMDEAQRLRNPGAGATQGAEELARQAKRLVLLSGTPITNSPTDLASLMSLLDNKSISPQDFEKRYIGYRKKFPGIIPWLRGAQWGEEPYVRNEKELRERLKGKVDYQPSKTPQGVTVNEETVKVPLSAEQARIQKAIRTQIPPGFLWKLDKEFPLSRDELKKLNSFLTGLRQVSLSTQPFRVDKDPLKAFDQSSKLREAMKRLRQNLDSDPRRKAIIYSNFIDSGVQPYAKALEREKIPYGIFHGGIPVKARQEALKNYNEGKLRALLLGPAAAEGISTKGTSLIQLLDPYWHESRTQQARGRGLRFDSHEGLPDELKNVAVQRFLSSSEDPGILGRFMGKRRQRTGDEVLQHLSENKEKLNEAFRKILREVGTEKQKATPAAPETEKDAPPSR